MVGEVFILSTIHGTAHIHMVCTHLGVMDMVDFTHLTITEAYIRLGDTDTVDGTHLTIVDGTILGTMEVTMVRAMAMAMDMEVVFMMDTILDLPITDLVEAQVFIDHQQVVDQVLRVLQDEQVGQQEAV